MTSIQKWLIQLLPAKWAASMEAESRSWVARCPHCGAEKSVWELGGIRWKAAGSPSVRLRCPSCGKTSFQKITRRV